MKTEHNYAFPVATATSNENIEANYWKCLYTSTDKKIRQYGVILPKRVMPAKMTPQHIAEVGLTRYSSDVAAARLPAIAMPATGGRCLTPKSQASMLSH